MEIWRTQRTLILLVMRMQDLIEKTCSVRVDLRVPWDEWSRDSAIIEVQKSQALSTFVYGVQVMVVQRFLGTFVVDYEVLTFNFGRRSTLPHWGGAGVTERKALVEGEMSYKFQSSRGLDSELLSLTQ